MENNDDSPNEIRSQTTLLRFEPGSDLKERLVKEAEANSRSLNGEMLTRLYSSFSRKALKDELLGQLVSSVNRLTIQQTENSEYIKQMTFHMNEIYDLVNSLKTNSPKHGSKF